MCLETQCRLTPFVSQVILGSNRSGKSTVLKLISRLYDPTEGTILIDGHDIKTLRMEDIRRAMAILFQDYTLFPVTVRLSAALRAIL
jgi:ABC-type multidrug transport system fused ATPase/permease subunit